ncbi:MULTISPECIES: helix-turn-helix domain-containing protein [unclassified Aureimonas]|uniref:helix-turn-helix domain-containing protein n=1 Tax=unclassified Aureimonas TaxID=2615206 RepID=UPI001FCD27FD|nr:MULTISPECIES: helix-turn-helix transcriptional regulator [unclassified Aureimonas]
MDDEDAFYGNRGMEKYRKIIAKNVRSARLALKMSQEAFADESKIDRTYISGIERGVRNPSLDMIVKIAINLNVTPAALLTETDKDQL